MEPKCNSCSHLCVCKLVEKYKETLDKAQEIKNDIFAFNVVCPHYRVDENKKSPLDEMTDMYRRRPFDTTGIAKGIYPTVTFNNDNNTKLNEEV